VNRRPRRLNPLEWPDGSHTVERFPVSHDPDGGIFDFVRDNATDKIYIQCQVCLDWGSVMDGLATKNLYLSMPRWMFHARRALIAPWFLAGAIRWGFAHRHCMHDEEE
jgi:hypothetical protein